VVVAIGLVSVVLLGFAIRRPWAGVAGAGALLCSAAGSTVLKLAIPRPDLGVAGSTVHNSFPSGHVAAATGLVLAFLLVVPARARWWLAAPGAVVVSAVAAATMIADWHRFSDALGAVALASMMCCLAAAALALWPGARSVPAPRHGASRGPAGGLGWAALVAATGTVGVAAAAAALPLDPDLYVAVAATGGFTAVSMAAITSALSVTRL
jgi:hypothetical protein